MSQNSIPSIPRKLKILLSLRPEYTVVAEKRHFVVTNPVTQKKMDIPFICDWKMWEDMKSNFRALNVK